jgi:hypothetical protein
VADSLEGKFGYIADLPDEIREAFMWLAQDVVALHKKWDLYLGFFGKPESLQVISHLPVPFHLIEESLRTDITMLIGRLSDSAKFGKDENISFRALLEFYSKDDASEKDDVQDQDKVQDQDAQEQDKVLEQLVADFIQICKPVTQNRHKLVRIRKVAWKASCASCSSPSTPRQTRSTMPPCRWTSAANADSDDSPAPAANIVRSCSSLSPAVTPPCSSPRMPRRTSPHPPISMTSPLRMTREPRSNVTGDTGQFPFPDFFFGDPGLWYGKGVRARHRESSSASSLALV